MVWKLNWPIKSRKHHCDVHHSKHPVPSEANDAELVGNSGYFDANYYKGSDPDLAKLSPSALLAHYMAQGGREGRAPSWLFDAQWYLDRYQDVRRQRLNPLVHYLKYGRSEGRKPTGGFPPSQINPTMPPTPTNPTDPTIKSDYEVIARSREFNESYYLSAYPDVRLAKTPPLVHFCSNGWKEARNPNESFNTRYYLDRYPDIARANVNPFVHWIKYGKDEQRKINVIEVKSTEATYNGPSLIFICHESSQTGAPAVLLTLLNWIKENTDIRFSIVIGHRGPWNDQFEKIAPCFNMDAYHDDRRRDELSRFCGNSVQIVYCNTIVSGIYASQLSFLNAEFITHVHEMENLFQIYEKEFQLLNTLCSKFIAVSAGAVDALKKRTNAARDSIVLIKPFISPKLPTIANASVSKKERILYGCGTAERRKGFDIFCDVALHLLRSGAKHFKMCWIGSTSSGDLNTDAEISERKLDGIVECLGVSQYPRALFGRGCMFLLPSREDPFPLVCLEAAECGLPVVCFDHNAGDMHTFVEEDAGIVVPYLDARAMATAARALLDDDLLRRRLGKQASDKVKGMHYVSNAAPSILAMMPKIVNSSASTELESYKELINSAEAVSFDLFDTLVARAVSDPEIAFDIVEYSHTDRESGPVALLPERMEAAGRKLQSYNGAVDDLNIDEIYDEMAFYTDSSLEKSIEIKLCLPHPVGVELYKHAVARGKVIYLASDMYLDEETVSSILTKCGITKYDRLFLSSALGAKKDSGRLFKIVVADARRSGLSPSEIIHIGDNWEGDVYKAKAAGLKAVHFVPLRQKGHNLFPLSRESQGALSQIGRVWNGFCSQATRLWHESTPGLASDFFTKLGFELTGPLAAMMAMFTKSIADDSRIKKIVFMARDGRIIKKAFDSLYGDEIEKQVYESHYMHLSRATVILATLSMPLTPNDLYFLTEGLHLSQRPLSFFLEKAGLDKNDETVIDIVESYFTSSDVIPAWNDRKKLTDMFRALSAVIFEANLSQRNALRDYLDANGCLSEERIAVVDVGWSLNVQSRLAKFLKTIGSRSELLGCYVGSQERSDKSVKHSALLFSGGDPARFARLLAENVTLFEVLFSSPEPAASGLKIGERASDERLAFREIRPAENAEYLISQKLHMGAEASLRTFKVARKEFFPDRISKDYFFAIFETLVNSDNEFARAAFENFSVRLGGHHEFISYESPLRTKSHSEYRFKAPEEYFEPIPFPASAEALSALIVTSSGLDNGSTRYRAFNLAEGLSHHRVKSTLIHAATDLSKAEPLIRSADVVIFQRCFDGQGNVGTFLNMSRSEDKICLAEMDDLVFPDFIDSIGSVTGGEWEIDEAKLVARSYERFLHKVDGCLASSPMLREYLQRSYKIPVVLIRNKVGASFLRKPTFKAHRPLRLIYASGTFSHRADFDLIEQTLYDIVSKTKSVRLSIAGRAQVSERLLALPNVCSYPLLPYVEMMSLISAHDLMLVPLVDNVFNRAKSCVKFLESAAVGVPVLASAVGEFSNAIRNNDTGFLAHTVGDWEHCLQSIVKDPTRLNPVASAAYEHIMSTSVSSQLEVEAQRFFQSLVRDDRHRGTQR